MKVRRWFVAGLLAVIVVVAVTLVTWWTLLDISTHPTVLDPAPIDPIATGDEVAFGVVSRYNPREIYRGYQPIMDYLSETTGRRFVLRLSESYAQTVRQLVDGEVAFASLGNYTYIHAHAEHRIRAVAVPLNAEGRPFFRSVIIVRDDSPLAELTDLRGQRFAFTSTSSMSYWMALHLLHGVGLGIADLGTTANFKHHETVAKEVLRGEFAAGAVKDIVARRYADQGLRVLTVSSPIPAVPIAAREDLDPALLQSVVEALLALDPTDPQDAARMANWDPEFSHGFAVAQDAEFDTMRLILKTLGDLPPTGAGGP